MKNKIRLVGQIQTIQTLTKKMLGKNKYAYVSFPKTALLAISPSNEKLIPTNFIDEINKSFSIKDPAYMRAVPSSFIYSADKDNELDLSILKDDSVYFNSSTLENYYNSNKSVFNSFVQFYLKNSPFITVSFNDKKHITQLLGFPAAYTCVPHNDYYNKLDEICNFLDEVKHLSDVVVLDCPILASGLAHRIWNKFDLSILDLGKIVSYSKIKFFDRTKFNDKKTYKN